jgi:putative transposase
MSGKRFQKLVNGEYYHVFNRSIQKEEILKSSKFLNRTLDLFEFYRFPQKLRFSYFNRLKSEIQIEYHRQLEELTPLIQIYAFSLMPNHYHLLLKQLQERGIEKFISNFQNSFAKYFNTLKNKDGPVFQCPFKAKHISTDSEFLHVSRYVHLNPVSSSIVSLEELDVYPWTSLPLYINKNNLINIEPIIKMCGSSSKYLFFVKNRADYQRKLNKIKHLMID